MATFHDSDDHFKLFAGNLEQAIEKYGDMPEETLLDRQKRQIETLVALEDEFRRTLISHPWGPGVYKAFVKYICEERRNILAARPYFRERQEVFTSKISKALKERSEKSLYPFHFNYGFILFAVRLRKWAKGSKIMKLANQIQALRTELIEMNMPLAISRARIFWSRTPKSQLSYMDLIQISCEGLMSAIDKFCLPFSRVFRAVAIGRMVGNFIDSYSETLVHFYPNDKRKIYRANKLIGRMSEVDYDKLAEKINEGVDPAHRTNSSEIADLLSAASVVSADSPITTDSGDSMESIERFSADESWRPDVQFERQELMLRLREAVAALTVPERKLIKMRGIQL